MEGAVLKDVPDGWVWIELMMMTASASVSFRELFAPIVSVVEGDLANALQV